MPQFLFEIGFEEMPARFLPGLSDEFLALLTGLFAKANIESGEAKVYATPRRLVFCAEDMAPGARREEVVVTGPPEKAAFGPDGRPTKAAMGFAKGQGADLSDSFILDTEKGRYLAVRKTVGGEKTLDLLPEICLEVVRRLSFPKKMRWGSREFAFGRPIRWFLTLLGEDVVPFEVEGIVSGRETCGHRVMGPGPFPVRNADEYFTVIREKGHVTISAKEREDVIVGQAAKLAAEVGGKPIIDPGLLTEVTGLTEHPVVVLARFDGKFLETPREALITSMQNHQKSFGVEDASGKLLPYFLTTLGLTPKNLDLVRKGWERVLTARLEDARFFWETDLACDMGVWLDKLENVIFLAGLGCMGDKSRRLEKLCGALAEEVGPEIASALRKAGRLAKADLVSEMVGEFAELQGIMGGIYARRKGYSDETAQAVSEQYLPAGPDSPVPASLGGAIVAIADKADTLAGCFGLDMIPTGAADPYALRRQALGICRIIIERNLRLSLSDLLRRAVEGYENVTWKLAPEKALPKLLDFFGQRLKAYFLGLGYDTLAVEAALGAGFDDIGALKIRLDALSVFAKSPDFQQAVLTFKRAANIIRKQGAEAKSPLTGEIKTQLLQEEAERALAAAFDDMFPRLDAFLEKDAYGDALAMLHELRPVVDGFFDNVMVMCDDPDLRLNRLNILEALVARLGRIADFSALQV